MECRRSDKKQSGTDPQSSCGDEPCSDSLTNCLCASCTGNKCSCPMVPTGDLLKHGATDSPQKKNVYFGADGESTSFATSFEAGKDGAQLLPHTPAVIEPPSEASANVRSEETLKSHHDDVSVLPSTEIPSTALEEDVSRVMHRDTSESLVTISSNGVTSTSIMSVDSMPAASDPEMHLKIFPATSDQTRSSRAGIQSTFSDELGDTQTLQRRTQSTPVQSTSDNVCPANSDDLLPELRPDSSSESNTTADVDDHDTEECITTETHYHLHLKGKDPCGRAMQSSVSDPPKLVSAQIREPTPVRRSSSSERSSSEPHTDSKSLLDYTRYLMGMDFSTEMHSDSDTLEDAWSVATKRRGVYNLIQVPVRLERLLSFVMFICADEFLSMFTFLPLRALFAVLKFLWFILCLPIRVVLRGIHRRPRNHLRPPPSVRKQRTKARIGNVIDVLHFSVLVFTSALLGLFDISWVYHNIRGQSVIKLYVVFNVLEIFDRLCSSFGVDILDSLGWTTASAVTFLSREPTAQSRAEAPSGSATRARAVQSVWLLSRVAFDYLFTLVYTGVHSILLLTWVVTLNVAINTKNNALITLLIANNFVELKGAVFKSYKIQNVFQIACADGVERFQLTVFLLIMVVYTAAGNKGLFTTWAIVYACEVIVDWIKHAFVTKFNRIPHRVYPQFSIVICEDIANARTHSVVRSMGGSAVSKRVGFVSLPLGALVARMAASAVGGMPVGAAFLLFATMVATKVALSIGLMGHAQRRLSRASQQQNEWPKEEEEMESKWYQSLVNVGRYDLISKS